MAEAKKLGELLKESGLIDDFQLQSALSHQRNWGGKLGSILIELGFVREEDLARVIAEKLRTSYVNLFEPEIPESVITLIKPEIAKKYHVVPAKRDKGLLTLAMSDPLDIEAIDAIRFITGLNVKPTLALESEIRDAIKKYYDGEAVVRTQEPPVIRRAPTAEGKMELIHGRDLAAPGAGPAVAGPDDRAELDAKIRLEALTALLIEKGLITREELLNMIYQKKMGL
jgi:type IV pilus assembly protein PilB